MSFEGPDVDNYGGDEDGHRKRDTSRKRDGKKDKKEKGYTMFEEEDSDGDSLVLADDLKSPSKTKGSKAKPFKFPVRKEKGKEKEDKKDKESKKEEKEKRREEKEGKKLKKDKKKSKITLHETTITIAAPGDYENPIFGVPLAVAVDRNKSHDGIELPAIVRECVDYIEECGLACEGIYRISGVKSKVQALKDSYNRHQPIYLYEHEPNIVASLLKQFLRDLPEPVLTTAMMPKFEDASTAKSNKKKVELFSKHILDLPACNRLLLSWMIVHMSHVIDLAKENKMTLQNVSIVLSPTMRISHRVLNVLFSNSQALFGDVQLRKYVPPLRPAHSKWSLELPDNLSSLEEELAKQESLLNQLHTDLNSGLTDPVIEEQLWEVQRVVTQLKRKIKLAKKGSGKNEAPKPPADPKRLSNSSLPSLSAPEELRLDLKPVPASKVTATSPTATSPTATSPTATTVTAAVDEPQPAENVDKHKEDTVTLESSKTVKFVGVPGAKIESDEKTEEKKIDKEDDVKDESKNIANEAETRIEEEEKEKDVEENDKELKNEGGNEEVVIAKKEEEKVETDKKEPQEELPKNEAVVAGGKSEKDNDDDNSDETNVSSVVENETKGRNEIETMSTESTSQSDGVENQERSDVKKEDIVEKKPEIKHEEPKNEVSTKSQEKQVEKEKEKEKKDAPNTTQPLSSTKRHSAPVPPFMSLTLLEPVKAEIPTRKKSVNEEEVDQENQRKSEEWRELEEELLGEKKEKRKSKEHSKEVPEKVEDDLPDDVTTEQMLEEEYSLVLEEEELMAIADELRQKMATECSEMERLAQEIQELHYLRQDSDLEDVSSDSNSSDESEDEEDLQDLLSQLIQDNQDLETQNAEMCQKIHEERMICLSVKLQIRVLQQKQLEASYG